MWKKAVQSPKPSSTIMKLELMRTATGKEDPELPLLQRMSSLELPGSHEDYLRNGRTRVTSAAEDTFIRVNCTSDYSPNECFTEFK